MNWIDKLERKFGNIYIPQLMNLILILQAAAWVIVMFINQDLYYNLLLVRSGLLRGQLWRLISFVVVPPLTTSPLSLVLRFYFYWFLGTVLERVWGGFRFNLYFLVGMLGAILSCLLFGSGDSDGLFLSLFFAYAWLFPDQEVLLFFVLPIKIKWLGWFSGAMWLLSFITAGSLAARASLVLGLSGFLVFFGRDFFRWCTTTINNKRRRDQWNNQWKR